MSRLHKKCFVASAGLHLLLALITFVCPAFLASKPKPSDVQLLTFIPSVLIDAPFAGGGDPNAGRPPAPVPAPPQPVVHPAPPPPTQPTRQPPREVVQPKSPGESLEVTKETTRKRLDISLTPVVRNPNAKPASRDTSKEDAQERDRLALREKLVGQLDRTLGNIKSGTASATKLGDYGPGGGGPSYAPYGAWVRKVYDDAWVRPDDTTSENATAEATVTVARDGTVIAKRITRRSGDPAVDASVQRVLDRVTTVGKPFPEGATDKQRIYIIPFNMKANRGTA